MKSIIQFLKLFLDLVLGLILRASWLPGNAKERGERPRLLELGDDQRIVVKVREEDKEAIREDFVKGRHAFTSRDYKTSINSFEAARQRVREPSAVVLHNTAMSRFEQARSTKNTEDYGLARKYASKAESLLNQPGEAYSERAHRIIRDFRGRIEANPVTGWRERDEGG
jgi:hypothetical protein